MLGGGVVVVVVVCGGSGGGGGGGCGGGGGGVWIQIYIGSSDHQFRNNLLFLKLNLTWTNVLSLSLGLGSEMNSTSL